MFLQLEKCHPIVSFLYFAIEVMPSLHLTGTGPHP